MNYVSTRGNGGVTTAAGAIKQGLASDGGLFMPEKLPDKVQTFAERELDYYLAHKELDYSEVDS